MVTLVAHKEVFLVFLVDDPQIVEDLSLLARVLPEPLVAPKLDDLLVVPIGQGTSITSVIQAGLKGEVGLRLGKETSKEGGLD